jgi:hypothetical protein
MAQNRKLPAPKGGVSGEIVTDPKSATDVMCLYGYLDPAPTAEHERLYLSPDRRSFVDLPSTAVLERRTVATEHDPDIAVMLLVRRSVALKSIMSSTAAPSRRAIARYFMGGIMAAVAGGVGLARAAETTVAMPTPTAMTPPVRPTTTVYTSPAPTPPVYTPTAHTPPIYTPPAPTPPVFTPPAPTPPIHTPPVATPPVLTFPVPTVTSGRGLP